LHLGRKDEDGEQLLIIYADASASDASNTEKG
jgi:hypothetical protein